MKRIALVFFLAILLPSILLAVLAIRSVRDQALITNTQRVLFYESTCESVASEINLFMDEVRLFHGRLLDELIDRREENLIQSFDEEIARAWSQAAVGAVVSDRGVILTPGDDASPLAREFLDNHRDFLANNRRVEVYQAPAVLNSELLVVEETAPQKKSAVQFSLKSRGGSGSSFAAPEAPAPQLKVGVSQNRFKDQRFEPVAEAPPVMAEDADSETLAAAPAPEAPQDPEVAMPSMIQQRNVIPAQSLAYADASGAGEPNRSEENSPGNLSRLSPAEVKSTDLTGADSGAVSRLIDGGLHILLWERHPRLPGYTFWTELDLETIQEDLSLLFSELPRSAKEPVSLVLLDSNGVPVAQTEAGFSADWSRPFVAAEVGQILPRWEVAAYFVNPGSINRATDILRWTLSLIVLSLLVAVAVGSYLILKAVRYEMQLATRKTDFVSNVSHELKTPLTSIRLFSELLAGAEEVDPEKTKHYSGIIHKEAARLSRLINRLLDFSRLDRDETILRRTPVDLSALAHDCVESFRMQAEAGDLSIQIHSAEEAPLLVSGDKDALEQVVLNLLSNAGKYGGGDILVELSGRPDQNVTLRVHDRGPGIVRGLREKIFEKFYRIDDSIHAGVEGSGIGLALCRQIVEKLDGEIRCDARKGGGTTFTVELPALRKDEAE